MFQGMGQQYFHYYWNALEIGHYIVVFFKFLNLPNKTVSQKLHRPTSYKYGYKYITSF